MTAYTTAEAHGRLRDAVAALCAEGPLVDRLESAYRRLDGLQPSQHLPTALQFRFEELLADIAYGADSVAEALSRMSAPDRDHLASRILSMFDDALRLLAPEN